MHISKGDVVQSVKTGQKRVVTEVHEPMGLIAFEDSHIVGWERAEQWRLTGERQAKAGE